MANTKSAKKAIRVTERKTVINLRIKRAYKEARKNVQKAISNKDVAKAVELLPLAYKQIDKASKKHVIHKNTAARYKSSLAKQIKLLQTA
jgi:small subunit ribosomal protein S20